MSSTQLGMRESRLVLRGKCLVIGCLPEWLAWIWLLMATSWAVKQKTVKTKLKLCPLWPIAAIKQLQQSFISKCTISLDIPSPLMGLILPRLSATNTHYSTVLQHSLMLNTHAVLVMKVTAPHTELQPNIIREMPSYRIHCGKCVAIPLLNVYIYW